MKTITITPLTVDDSRLKSTHAMQRTFQDHYKKLNCRHSRITFPRAGTSPFAIFLNYSFCSLFLSSNEFLTDFIPRVFYFTCFSPYASVLNASDWSNEWRAWESHRRKLRMFFFVCGLILPAALFGLSQASFFLFSKSNTEMRENVSGNVVRAAREERNMLMGNFMLTFWCSQ